MTARELAGIGYRGFLEGKVIVIPGLLNKIGAQSVRISPRAMVRKVTRKLQES
jgi:short-subunit dehydrogenase